MTLMKKFALIVIFSGALMVMITPGVGRPAGVLKIGIGVDADSLNPWEMTTTLVSNVVDFMVEPLFYQDEKGDLKPLLATGRTISPDEKVWTLTLRKGVKFHDGTDFTAYSVKAHFARMMDPKTKVPIRFYIGMVDRVEVTDPYTIKFFLKYPYSPFERVLATTIIGIMSEKSIERPADEIARHPIGSGPFKFVEWVEGERIVMERNDQYWGKKSSLDKIIFFIVPEHTTREAMLRAGDLDMIVLPPPPDLAALEADPNIKVIRATSTRYLFLGMNNQKEPFKDKLVRQAFNYAVDKETIVKKILFNCGQPADAPMSPTLFGYHPVTPYRYNPEKAKKLLKQANFSKDTKVTILTPTGRYLFDIKVAEAVQAYLGDVGVKADLRTYDWPTLIKMYLTPLDRTEVQIFLLGWGPWILDADMMMYGQFHSSQWPPKGLAPAFYKNEKVDELIEGARQSSDLSKRKDLYKKAIQSIWEDAPFIFLYAQKFVLAYRKNIKGVVVLPIEKFNVVYAHKD